LKRLVVIACLLGATAIQVVSAPAEGGHTATVTSHCGSFKFGTDGLQPGPSGISASHVSCWFARATALLGPAPGWHCHITVGITLVCKPRHGNGVVIFFGE
jgi:hypothetical protein